MKDDDFWVEDTDGQYTLPNKRRRGAKNKLEFVGWGSRPLVEFLNSVGKDTTKPLTQHEVTTIVKEYINVNNLPLKKKRFLCDDRLYAIFGKSVPRLKIYDALEKHFAENHDESEDEEDSSEEDDDAVLSGKRKSTATLLKKLSEGKANSNQTSKSCFAAIIPENIKLVYLKKSLVLQLLEVSDDFEEKVKGSLVRIKSDRNDYLQKLPYHLEQVTGLKKVPGVGNGGSDTQLLVSNSIVGVPLKMLSDDNFSEEECVDLHERTKAGLVKRPTVVQLTEKAEILHEDIIKHWIPREIKLLQKLIDRANEKGWRKVFTLYEYLQKRQLLMTDAEQQRLLLQMPEVVAEELEHVDPPAALVDNSIGVEGNSSSPNSTLRGLPETSSRDASGTFDACNIPQPVVETGELDKEDQPVGQGEEKITSEIDREDYQPTLQAEPNQDKLNLFPLGGGGYMDMAFPFSSMLVHQPVRQLEENLIKSTRSSGIPDSRGVSEKLVAIPPVIELSDDEEEPEEGIQSLEDKYGLKIEVEKLENGIQSLEDKYGLQLEVEKPVKGTQGFEEVQSLEDKYGLQLEVDKPDNELQQYNLGTEDAIWFYADPQNQTQGPFTIQSLKIWSDLGYFPSQFKIWRLGQNQDQAVFLADALDHIFFQRRHPSG